MSRTVVFPAPSGPRYFIRVIPRPGATGDPGDPGDPGGEEPSPRGYPLGYSSRQHSQFLGASGPTWKGLCQTAVVEVTHDASGDQPAAYPANATLDSPMTAEFVTWLNQRLDFYSFAANFSTVTIPPTPMFIVLRPRTGIWMMDWAKDLCGGAVRYCTNKGWDDDTLASSGKKGLQLTGSAYPSGTYEINGGTLRYWHANGPAVLRKFHVDLAAIVASRTQVVAVDVAYAATEFQEPVNQLFGIERNMTDFLAGGWTKGKHIQAFRDSWAMALAVWVPLRVLVCTSFNPGFELVVNNQGVTQYKPGAGYTWSNDLMDEMVATIGHLFAVVQTKSFDAGYTQVVPRDKNNMGSIPKELFMQDKMHEIAADTALQTETLTNIVNSGYTVKQTLVAAVAMGAMWVELPNGCQNASRGSDQITTEYARANAPGIGHHAERTGTPQVIPPSGGSTQTSAHGYATITRVLTPRGPAPMEILVDDVLETPANVNTFVSGGPENALGTWTVDNDPTSLGTQRLDGSGNARSSFVLPALGEGPHVLKLTFPDGEVGSVTFYVLNDPVVTPPVVNDDHYLFDPGPLDPIANVVRWQLIDPKVGGEKYTFPLNPDKMSPPHAARVYTERHTTAFVGKDITFEGRRLATEWTVRGTTRTEEHHDALRRFQMLNRRLIVVDHYNRGWLVAFDTLTFEPTTVREPWTLTYEMKFLIFSGAYAGTPGPGSV